MIKIHVLQTGRVSVDIGVPLQQKNPLAKTGWFRGSKNRVWLPVSAYLIEHPKGLILIDTGWDLAQRNNQVKRIFGQLPISYGELPEGLAVNEQIKALGFQIADIDEVFITHMDVDHAGGMKLVKGAKRIRVSEEEWCDSEKKQYFYRYRNSLWEGMNVETFAFSDTGKGPVGRSFDVFGDGSLTLVSTPGHSHGLFTAVVKDTSRMIEEQQYVAIIGDTGYMEKSWKELWLPGLSIDKPNAKKSLEWIQKLSHDRNCKEILATHDPAVKPHIIEI